MRIFTQVGWLTVQATIFLAVFAIGLSIPAPDTPQVGMVFMGAVFSAWLVTLTLSVLTDLAKLAVEDLRRWSARRKLR